jgi:hypothetical protein
MIVVANCAHPPIHETGSTRQREDTNKNSTRRQRTASNLIDFPSKAYQQEFRKTAGIVDRKPNIGATKTLWELPLPPSKKTQGRKNGHCIPHAKKFHRIIKNPLLYLEISVTKPTPTLPIRYTIENDYVLRQVNVYTISLICKINKVNSGT